MSTETIAPDGEIITGENCCTSGEVTLTMHCGDPILAALARAQAEFPEIPKDLENTHFKSRYSSLDAIITACRPVLAKHGLGFVHKCSHDGDVTICTCYLMDTETGRLLEMDSEPLRGMLTSAQAAGSARTYARRYTLAASLGITSDEDDDGNAASQGGAKQQQTPRGKQNAKPPAKSQQQGKQQPAAGLPQQTPEEWENEKFNLAKQKLATLIKAVEVDEYVTKLADNKHMKERPRLLERILKFALQVTEAKVQKKEWDEKTGDDLQRRLGELLPADADQATQAHFAF